MTFLEDCRRFLIGFFILAGFLPATLLADGKMFHTAVAHVEIPEQEALIVFDGKTERLVINTAFENPAETGDFAWVVPLPAVPNVEAATTGLFPTLRVISRPRVVADSSSKTVWCIGLMLVVLLAGPLKPRRKFLVRFLVLFFLYVVVLAVAIPNWLGSSSALVVTNQGVTIHARQNVGAYDTVTISARDSKGLLEWLSGNGFKTSPGAGNVIADYIADGWCFVASKLRRDESGGKLLRTHPLSFEFPAKEAVYPLRLTGVGNGSLGIALYVFGPGRAMADGFAVERCGKVAFPSEKELEDVYGGWSLEPVSVVHPGLRRFVRGEGASFAPVVTKLTATLDAAAMRNDVVIRWGLFQEARRTLFSRGAALRVAGDVVAPIAMLAVVILVGLYRSEKVPVWLSQRRFTWLIGTVVLVGGVVWGVIFITLPKISEDRVSRSSWRVIWSWHDMAADKVLESAQDLPSARAAVAATMEDESNPYTGLPIREDDSPMNYTLRERDGKVEYIRYDEAGGAHVVSGANTER
ncbi:MAG: DUF2330 domain-containing protein [Planctomycetota bacterium]